MFSKEIHHNFCSENSNDAVERYGIQMKLEANAKRLRLPPWLKRSIPSMDNANFTHLKKQVKKLKLATVCNGIFSTYIFVPL